MATSNNPVGRSWMQVASDSNTDLLVTWNDAVELEVATTSTNQEPTVSGHRVTRDDAISRGVIGPGYVWVRLVGSNPQENVFVVISK